ncbi:ImmA/IrrE family metallo-endopeptidase [Staphylococcus epidermidis]
MAETKTILFNPIEHENRRRFTIAHELGHAVFNHSGNLLELKYLKNITMLFQK